MSQFRLVVAVHAGILYLFAGRFVSIRGQGVAIHSNDWHFSLKVVIMASFV
nr:hypothetical protein [Jeotgalibacillus malaysiensis]